MANALLGRCQLGVPVSYGALQTGERDVEVKLLLRLRRDIHPPLVVAAGIVSVGLVHEHQPLSAHAPTEDEVLQGIIQAVLHCVHALLADSGIEDGRSTILVHERDALVGSHNAVGTGSQSLGCGKLIAGLEPLALGELDVTGSPILVGGSHHQPGIGTDDVSMDHRFADISPQLDADVPVGNLDIALAQVQNLAEVLHVEPRRETDAEAALLEQGVVLVETSGARHIEQDVAFLHPHIHTDVSTSAGHRPAGVLTGRAPDIVLGLCTDRQQGKEIKN